MWLLSSKLVRSLGLYRRFPPVKRLPADTEIAARQCCVVPMSPVVVHPLHPLPGHPANALYPGQAFGSRTPRSYYLHDDTILSVTHHYEREQHARTWEEGVIAASCGPPSGFVDTGWDAYYTQLDDPGQAGDNMNLQIKDVKVHVLCMPPPAVSYSADPGLVRQSKRYMGVLRIISGDGLEGNCFVGNILTDNTHGILPLVEKIKPILIGQDIWGRELAWHQLRETAPRWDVGDPTIMAVDVALWDLAAKAADVPLYKLMGAYRSKVHACASAPYHDDVEANVEEALMYKERGFAAYKLHHAVPNLRKVIQVCTAVRQGCRR